MINLVLVEDHSFVTEGVRAMLATESGIACIHYCATGAALLHFLKQQQPDVILMDINLPDASGIDLCREVKQIYPGIFIIALSINNQPGVIRKMMEHGASGFVLKDADKYELISAITAVTRGKQFFSRSAAAAMRKPDKSVVPALTRREKEILTLIADGLTNKEIAENLCIEVSTVDSHRKNMLAKYDVKNSSALIKIAVMHKLI